MRGRGLWQAAPAGTLVRAARVVGPARPRRTYVTMRGVKKENLPSKVCVVCERPFTWRKKWERCWDEVTTCSKSCNAKRRAAKQQALPDGTLPPSPRSDLATFTATSAERGTTGGGDRTAAAIVADTAFCEPAPAAMPIREVEGGRDAQRRERKEAVKALKAERRARRSGDVVSGQKACDLCAADVDLLVRCQTDATQVWHMVCGRCWNGVSGGVVDGDGDHPHYRYGGLWKNRRALLQT